MKILLLRGLPASGKSTTAKEIVQNDGNWVRVNRDLLREMIHCGKWHPRHEEGIIDIEKGVAAYYLCEEGKNVVVDDCNLGQKHFDIWNEWAGLIRRTTGKSIGVDIRDNKVSWQECVKRDEGRGNKVGPDVIKQFAMQYERLEPTKFVISDMDGTLCDNHERATRCLDREDGKKDWKAFFDGIPADPPREDVIKRFVHEVITHGALPIIVSARPERTRQVTLDWMAKHNVPFWTLIMRRDGDHRPDDQVKREILKRYFPDQSKIVCVFDDRPSVIRMWKEEGLTVYDEGKGIEF